MKSKFGLLVGLIVLTFNAHSRPDTITLASEPIRAATEDELHNLASTNGCSAGYVDIGRKMNAKAIIVTNGHCASGSLRAGQAMINLPVSKAFSIFSATGSAVKVTAVRLLYATLMDTDIAFYELKETNAELDKKNLQPFPFFQGRAPLGAAVRVTSGYWKETQECTLARRVHKVLEGFGSDISAPSIATQAYALSANCKIRGGYSGTPVIDTATNSIIAMAFTGAEGNESCAERSPCEEDVNGNRVYRKGISYVSRVDQLSDCIYDGEFNLSLPSCTFFR